MLDAFMCWNDKYRAFGSVKDPFANATYKKLIHGASPMRTYNNHVYAKF